MNESDPQRSARLMKTLLAVLALLCGACTVTYRKTNLSQLSCPPPAVTPAFPLHTQGRWILDHNNQRVKLAGVNWYGAEEQDYVVAGLELAKLVDIAVEIKRMGFNSVRLPWSNELYESNPLVSDAAVAANPQLKGLHAMDVFDAVVNALAAQGLLIILDNHVSTADWCCYDTDGNGLWYNPRYPETNWIVDWQGMAERYRSQPTVVAVDLRNELRAGATWGGDPQYDWHAAAQRAGNAILSVNPNLLVIVEGINYASGLTGVAQSPIVLNFPNRVVYSAHDYAWFHSGLTSYGQVQQQLNQSWGYILTESPPAPVWVGEFGTCHTGLSCFQDSAAGSQGLWFSSFLQYLGQSDFDWCYWPLNGTEARGTSRTFGSEETYGVLNTSWDGPAVPEEPGSGVTLLGNLQTIIPPCQ